MSSTDEEAHREQITAASIAPAQDAIARGLHSLEGENHASEHRRVPLDPERYSILKR